MTRRMAYEGGWALPWTLSPKPIWRCKTRLNLGASALRFCEIVGVSVGCHTLGRDSPPAGQSPEGVPRPCSRIYSKGGVNLNVARARKSSLPARARTSASLAKLEREKRVLQSSLQNSCTLAEVHTSRRLALHETRGGPSPLNISLSPSWASTSPVVTASAPGFVQQMETNCSS